MSKLLKKTRDMLFQRLQMHNLRKLLKSGYVLQERWQLSKEIGSGNFGLIYQAIDITTDEMVAVKVEPADQKISVS